MKNLSVLFTALCLSFGLLAQTNDGDRYLGVQYMGYIGGKYIIQATNFQAGCNPVVRIDWEDVVITAVSPSNTLSTPDSSINYNQVTGASTTFYLTGAYSLNPVFKFQVQTICTGDFKGTEPELLTIIPTVILPVDFVSFAAQEQNGSTAITWSTAQEQNVNYFLIEGSVDGKNWETVTKISSQWKGGNSSVSANYEYIIVGNQVAGIGTLVCILLALGMVFKGRRFKGDWIPLGLLIAILSFVSSCKKENIISSHSSYAYFRISEVDLDGKSTQFQQIVSI